MSSPEQSVVWNEGDAEGPKYILTGVQRPNCNNIKEYCSCYGSCSCRVTNSLAKHRGCLVENGHTVVSFLPVSVGNDLYKGC